MSDPFQTQMTAILNGMSKDDASIPEDFVALLYGELKQMAKIQMVRQRADHTLQPTALVNEIWMRVQPDSEEHSWESRRHFFKAAACAMRSVLVDHARGRQAIKRGGGEKPVSLNEEIHMGDEDVDSVLELDEALSRLEAEDPDLAELVQLRFYAGMAHEEIADQLNVSVRTVERRWRAAKLWLLDDLSEEART
ncbi:MAG: RNA polymerase subunit sigma [Planctomycetes bacterium]|nr:RNA polymerase subunit sigma [Planctomycetota bacterium]HJM56610.1 ECF-type sigma factor [Planctomycetota bacterium]